MTIDWFVWLTPLILLPMVALFVFVGCHFDTSGLKSQLYPGLKVNTKDLKSTAWFEARWHFSKSTPADPLKPTLLGDLERPIAPPHQENVPAGQDVSLEADGNDPDLMNILQLEPTQVCCECIVQDANLKIQSVKLITDWVDYPPPPGEATTMMVWVLSRDNSPQQNYSLEKN